MGQKQNEREIGYFYNLYKEEGQNSSGGSSSFLTNLGAAARGRKRKGKRKKGSKGSTMDWSSSHMQDSSILVSTSHSMGN